MALAKRPGPPPSAPARTAPIADVTDLSPSAPDSSSEPVVDAPTVEVLADETPAKPDNEIIDNGNSIIPGGPPIIEPPAREGDGPMVPAAMELPDPVAPTTAAYTSGVFDVAPPQSSSALEAPSPIQNDLAPALAELPPRPANLPDGHIIWPGDPLTVKGHLQGGALITDCRHHEAYIVAGSRSRWSFKLIYAAGVEVRDRRLAARVMEANQLRVPAGA